MMLGHDLCLNMGHMAFSKCFFYLILNYYLQLKCYRQDFTLAPTSIIYSRIVPHRHMYWHCLLRIESKILGGLPHHTLLIAQFMLGLLISQVDHLLSHPPPRTNAEWWVLYEETGAVSAVATVDLIKSRNPLESFLFGFGCLGGGGVRVARETLYM